MRFLRPPNTTFDLYILPNVPPKGPDLSSKGYLHTWFFPGMQNNEGATGRKFFYDSCIDVEETTDARDDWTAAPATYRIYIPTKMDQGYDVVFVERFRELGLPDFKRIFLKRRQWSSQSGLITEGGLHLTGASTQARPIAAIGGVALRGAFAYLTIVTASGGLHLAGIGSYVTAVTASGGLSLRGASSLKRPISAAGGLSLAGTSTATRPYAASGGMHLAGKATLTRPYAGAGGLHLAGKVRQIAFGGLHLAGSAHVMRHYSASGGLHLRGAATPPTHP
jgi:hypothetical protein